jgi:hypothetical protein
MTIRAAGSPDIREIRQHGPRGLRKEKRMSENSWYVLKIASLVLAVMGMTVLVMTIMMGQNGAQGY